MKVFGYILEHGKGTANSHVWSYNNEDYTVMVYVRNNTYNWSGHFKISEDHGATVFEVIVFAPTSDEVITKLENKIRGFSARVLSMCQ